MKSRILIYVVVINKLKYLTNGKQIRILYRKDELKMKNVQDANCFIDEEEDFDPTGLQEEFDLYTGTDCDQ